MMPPVEPLHCENAGGDDRTLCGDSLDMGELASAGLDPDAVNPVLAKQNEPITCDECLRIIRKCRDIAPWRVGAT